MTGGLGGIGRRLARWLVDKGVRHLVLTGRRGLATAGARALVTELEARGTRVQVGATDVANRAGMAELLAQLPPGVPVTSVFHTAGLADRTPLGALDEARLREIFASKAAGLLVLEDLLRTQPIEAFVCFGSIAGAWGSGGQAAYAAANAFQEGWAHARRARGERAVTVCWGPWSDDGMVDARAREELERRGLHPMSPTGALAALEGILVAQPPAPIVAHIDWPRFRRAYEAWGARPLVSEMPADPGQSARDERGTATVRDELGALPPEARVARTERWLATEVTTILGLPAGASLAPDRRFVELGLDSLGAVELRSRIERAFGRRLDPTAAFDHPTIASLARHLLGDLAPAAPAAPPPP